MWSYGERGVTHFGFRVQITYALHTSKLRGRSGVINSCIFKHSCKDVFQFDIYISLGFQFGIEVSHKLFHQQYELTSLICYKYSNHKDSLFEDMGILSSL